jgi:prepilin-type N-terminal cleavage/methylation domain-containing protein
MVKKMIKIKRISGFTLMELMIVIAIIAIMASIAIPNFIGWLPERRLDAGAQDILQGLQKSRSKAIMTNRNVIVTFDAGDNSFIAFVDDNTDGDQDAGELTIINRNLPAGVVFDVLGFGATVTFDNRGIPTNSGVLSLQNNNGNGRSIELYLSGHSVLQ